MVDEERLRELTTALRRQAGQKLSRFRWAFLWRGLAALLLAALALLWPMTTIDVLLKVLGGYFLLESLPNLYLFWRQERKLGPLLSSLISIALGLVLLFWPGVSAKVFLVLLGGWSVLQGGSMFLASRRLGPDEPERGPLQIVGLLLAVVGLVLFFWPNTGVVAVSWLISACSALVGAVLVFLSTKLHQWRRGLEALGQRERTN